MATYLVTGGCGFIGSHITAALVEAGIHVRVFDNLSTGKEANLDPVRQHVELVIGDLRDLDSVQAAMHGVEVVFHEAAVASVPGTVADPIGSLAANVTGTQHVLVAARNAGIRRLVFASSTAVYGDSPTNPKREDLIPNPQSPYAVHKVTGEYLCRVFQDLYGLETVSLRYFNVFGPRQDPASEYAAVVPRFLTALTQGRQPVVFGDGEQTRDFIYIGDVVRANLLAAQAPAAAGTYINIGTGQSISLNELLRVACDLTNCAFDPIYVDARPGDIRHSSADITLARQLLAFEPSVSLRSGLLTMLGALPVSADV